LIESCEAIERNQEDTSNAKATHKDKKSKTEKSSNSSKKRESGNNDKSIVVPNTAKTRRTILAIVLP
jgi:hypothetical protein